MQPEATPISLALVDDYEVIVRGLRVMFQGDSEFEVRELNTRTDPDRDVDIALCDSFSREASSAEYLRRMKGNPHIGRLVVYTWAAEPAQVQEALEAGARGYLSKRLGVRELKDALRRIHAGETVCLPGGQETPGDDEIEVTDNGYTWPGRAHGLTYRESEVLCLITDGLTNEEIAAQLYLSINSVKSYIRTAYRRMGVERRSQAIRWALEHGLYARTTRDGQPS